MKYFVTGGAGFVGSNFVRGLLDGSWGTSPELVTVYDLFTYATSPENLAAYSSDPRLHVIKGDIRDGVALSEALPGHDVIIHLAAESHVDRSIESPSVFMSTNILGTQMLLESALAHGVPCFVHASTDEVYGSIESGSSDETFPLLPNSPYASSKASSDLVARAYHQTYGLDVRITRSSNNFGTHQHPEKVIPLFITNLIDGKQLPLYGDGMNIREWMHVDDHCRGIDLVIKGGLPGEVYNIGGGTPKTNRELTALLLEAFDVGTEKIDWVEDRRGHDRRYSLDWSKINRELGYLPTQSLHDSLQSLVEWYRKNEGWWRPLKGG